MNNTGSEEYVLSCENLSKCFGGIVQANDHISFHLKKGEVHALLGENGAGKSTLMKMLYGLEQPDEGRILINGVEVHLHSCAQAIATGIGMVHQELMLIPHLTVAENIILGMEMKTRMGKLDLKSASKAIRELSESYGLDIDPDVSVDALTIGQRQRVEIIKLLYRKADILIFDEPTALLTPQESDALFTVLKRLKDGGKSIIFITHKLREVYQIADRMTVIRNGKLVGTTDPQATDMSALTQMMVGKTVSRDRRMPHPIGEDTVLAVEDLTVKGSGDVAQVDHLNLTIRKGEILGVAGIEGNGQTQLAQAILGLVENYTGRITLNGQVLSGKTTKEIREEGVGSIPDDRQGLGLILDMSIYENMLLNTYADKPFAKNAVYEDWSEVRKFTNEKISDFAITAANESVKVRTLSGGNQQKIIVAREVTEECKLLIAAQPTRGVDIASADYIQKRILQAAENGCAVLLISSDLDEILKVSDRVMVMFRGKVTGTLDGDEATRESLGHLMLGEHGSN